MKFPLPLQFFFLASAMATDPPSLPLSTMIHVVNIKFTSTNYLLWHAQIEPILASQNFLPFVDGSSLPTPVHLTTAAGATSPNPAHTAWSSRD